jgi:hypothetical protein
MLREPKISRKLPFPWRGIFIFTPFRWGFNSKESSNPYQGKPSRRLQTNLCGFFYQSNDKFIQVKFRVIQVKFRVIQVKFRAIPFTFIGFLANAI